MAERGDGKARRPGTGAGRTGDRGAHGVTALERRRRVAASGRRPRLDREAIVAATLAIIDSEGIDGVSMRRVAAEFDTGPSSLYVYVANKDELLRVVFDRVCQDVEMPADGPWQDVMRAWATSQRAVLRAHRDLARVAFAHVPTGPRMIEILDRLLGTMRSGGVPTTVAAWAVDAIALYITAHVYEDDLLAHSHSGGAGEPSHQAGQESIAMAVGHFATLDPHAFPNVHSHLGPMMSGDHDARFEFGLGLLIAGIERMSLDAEA